jgi:hypothetical protein
MAVGDALWAKGFSSTGASSYLQTSVLEIDTAGNSYIAGTFSGSASFATPVPTTLNSVVNTNRGDLFVAKLDASGNPLWAKSFTGSGDEGVTGLTFDNAGNIYIGGYFDGNSLNFGGTTTLSRSTNLLTGSGDYFVTKLNGAGDTIWAVKTNSSSNNGSIGDIVADPTGVYLTGLISNTNFAGAVNFGGTVLTTNSGDSVYAAKLNANGSFAWAKKFGDVDPTGAPYPRTPNLQDENSGNDIELDKLDGTGNVYIAGTFYSGIEIGGTILSTANARDIYIAKLNASGNTISAQAYGGAGNEIFSGKGFKVDTSGNQYLAVRTYSASASFGNLVTPIGATGSGDLIVAKLNDQGSGVWAQRFPGLQLSPFFDAQGELLRTDSSGNAYIAGNLINTITIGGVPLISNGGSTGVGDVYVAKLSNANGSVSWAKNFGGTGSESISGLAVDSTGKSYITGNFRNSSTTSVFGNTALSGNGSFVAQIDGSNAVTGTAPVGSLNMTLRNDNGLSTGTGGLEAWKLQGNVLSNRTAFKYANGTPVAPGADFKLVSANQDFNNDGIKDLVWFNTVNQVSVIWHMAKDAATGLENIFKEGSEVYLPNGTSAYSAAGWDLASVGDLRGDSQPEFLWRNPANNAVIWELTRTGQGATLRYEVNMTNSGYITYGGTPVSNTASWKIAGIGNFDANPTNREILWYDESNAAKVIWRFDGTSNAIQTGSGAVTNAASVGVGWKPAIIANLDGVGGDEVVWQNGTSVAIWKLGSSNNVISQASLTLDAGDKIQGAADFDLNGSLDLVVRRKNSTSDRTRIHYLSANAMNIQSSLDVVQSGQTTPYFTNDSKWDIVAINKAA